jgi:DNA-directed RNA polymerase specialized sigma subunit
MTIDKKIEEALNNKDIMNIMHKAAKRFTNQLDQDTIYTCKINALWKAFLNFKPDKNTKFTTYLYQGVFIECLKEIKFQNKSKRCNQKLHDNIAYNSNEILTIDILDEINNEEDKSLLIDKMNNLTIQEMADKRAYSRETVRKKLKKIIHKIQLKYTK